MIRPLRLPDALPLAQLQPLGIHLDLRRALLWPHQGRAAAMSALWPFNGRELRTLVMNHADGVLLGYLQYRELRERQDAELIFGAPSLQKTNDVDVSYVWLELLTHLVKQLGERGIQRIYARVLDGAPELDLFWRLGFSAYARARIYERTHEPPAGKPPKPVLWRPQRPRDLWIVNKLYSAVTPKLVQLAENLPQKDAEAPYRDSLGRRLEQKYVWAVDDEARASLRIIRGDANCWLNLILNPRHLEQSDALLQEALRFVPTQTKQVYVSVREYQSELTGAIAHANFTPLATEMLMVKHTTVFIKKPVLKPLPVMAGVKARPTTHMTRLLKLKSED